MVYLTGKCLDEDFRRGVAQAHTVLGTFNAQVRLNPVGLEAMTKERWHEQVESYYGLDKAAQDELVTDNLVEILRQPQNRYVIASPKEHVMLTRVLKLDWHKRGASPSDPKSRNTSTPEPVSIPVKATPDADMESKLRQLVQEYDVRCDVELLVVSPPERHFESRDLDFFKVHVESDASPTERSVLARFFMVTRSANFFRKWAYVHKKIFGKPMELQLAAVPLHIFNLPANFFTLPPAVRKVVTLKLSPQLKWCLDLVTIDADWFPPARPEE